MRIYYKVQVCVYNPKGWSNYESYTNIDDAKQMLDILRTSGWFGCCRIVKVTEEPIKLKGAAK